MLSGSRLQCDHGLRRQTIVESLLADVFQGRLQAGQHLVTQALAERFGVSHTPIREALIMLAGIGIVDLAPNRGAIVRAVTAREAREVLQVRKILECQAVRSACGQIELAVLHDLAEELGRLGGKPDGTFGDYIRKAREVDSRLHELIADSCGNAFLARELGRLRFLFRAFRDLTYQRDEARNDHRRLTEEAGEHLAIVEALQKNDADRAVKAMRLHLRSGVRYWTRAMPGGPESTRPAKG
jgi:DNA-binding GntR family transcriptional regulator